MVLLQFYFDWSMHHHLWRLFLPHDMILICNICNQCHRQGLIYCKSQKMILLSWISQYNKSAWHKHFCKSVVKATTYRGKKEARELLHEKLTNTAKFWMLVCFIVARYFIFYFSHDNRTVWYGNMYTCAWQDTTHKRWIIVPKIVWSSWGLRQ